jgi:hypothetical protein
VQQPCSNLSKSSEMFRNASAEKYGNLQAFCKLGKTSEKCCASFDAEEASGSNPLSPTRKKHYFAAET